MTIFDQGYSVIRYDPVGRLGRIAAIAQMEFGKIFRSKKGLILFIASVVYVVVLLVLVFVTIGPQASEYQQGLARMSPRLSPFSRQFYLGYSVDQGLFAFVALTAVVSVRSISGDRAVNALEIYWTRGLSPWGYLLGKWLGSFLLLAAVFVVGPLVAWLYAMISSPDLTFVEATIRFVPLVILALIVKCLVLSFLAVAFSGIGPSPNIVTFLWLALILGTSAVSLILKRFSRIHSRRNPGLIDDSPEWYDAISPWNAMVRVEEEIAGLSGPGDYSIWIAVLVLGILAAILLLILRKHLRTTEAMA